MITSSAPAKIILFGEHAVNRQQPAIATALDARTRCALQPRDDARVLFRSGAHSFETDCKEIITFTQAINTLRSTDDRTAIREYAGEYFAPVKYVLGTFLSRYGGSGANIEWHSRIPAGSGLGSGAAASAALVLALARANSIQLSTREIADLAWNGDIIAHGGIASGLDTSASTYGGVIQYTLRDGATQLTPSTMPILVVGDTGVRANTAIVNARVNDWLAQDAARMRVFEDIGDLTRRAIKEIECGDWQTVGGFMNENHALLREMGVSSAELERLVGTARQAGAFGAKLAGAGGGGVMVALTTMEHQKQVAQAITGAGGRALVVNAGVQGVQDE